MADITPEHPIRRLRRGKGLSLRALAKLACVHYSRICLIENGLRAREDEILRLAGVLRVHPEQLTVVPVRVDDDEAMALHG